MRPVCAFLSSLIVFSALSTPSFAATQDRVPAQIDISRMVELKNHVSPFAQPERDAGTVDPAMQLTVTMLFTPSAAQEQALDKLLAQQQDQHSPNFHKWLTPTQFADRFGLSKNDTSKIAAWLKSQGFQVTYVAHGRDFVTFTGPASLMQSVFRTEIHNYNLEGKSHFANVTPPMIPEALSGIVGGFRGLHNFFRRPMLRPHPAYTISGASTHFLAPGDIAKIYDINPLYQASTPIDGTGQKIVIVGQTDVYLADLNFFRNDFGLPAITGCTTNSSGVITACNSTYFKFVISGTTGAGDPGVNAGDLGESDLDIEWSGAVARNAQIIFVTSSLGVDDSATWAIDNTLAPVMSMSYGLCEALDTAPPVATDDLEFKKAAGLGISFFASSGDSGAATCDGVTSNTSAQFGLSVSYPASSQYVTAVGGTEFNEGTGSFWSTTNGTNGVSATGYIPELAWNDSGFAGGLDATGGGPSNCVNTAGSHTVTIQGQSVSMNICDTPPNGGFAKPAYQTAVTPSDGVRDVPDISFSASNANDPYIICTPQSETNGTSSASTCSTSINTAITTWNSAFGGTSVSSPVMAGITALLNQYMAASSGQGNINTQLYALYPNSTVFHDVVSGTSSATGDNSDNVVPCVSTDPSFEPLALRCPAGGSFGYSAGAGYDLTTGLGSLDVNEFFIAWAASVQSFSLSAAPGSATVMAGHNSGPITITITPINGFTGTVNFSSSSCSGLPNGASCSFNPMSVASPSTTTTLTIVTSAGTSATTTPATVTISASGVSATAPLPTVSLTVTATNQSFTLAPTNATLSVVQGLSGNTGITMTPVNGFNSNLSYLCTTTAPESTCSISPSGLTNTNPVTLSVATTAPITQLQPPLGRGSRIFYAALLPGLFGIFFTAGSRTRAGRTGRLLGLIVVLIVSTLWLGSCGGTNSSNKDPGTPVGSYTLTVNASTGGGTPVNGSTTVTLNVTAR